MGSDSRANSTPPVYHRDDLAPRSVATVCPEDRLTPLDRGRLPMTRLAFSAAALALVILATPGAIACPGEKIKVTLVVVLASEEGDFVDPRLKAVADEIKGKNPNLKSFKLKTMTSKS